MTFPELVRLPFDADEGYGSRARIGLIVLQSDQTIEVEARMLDIDRVEFYHSRIPNDVEVTPETLIDMEQRLPTAAGLLPADFGFEAIGYGCTSAAALIGEAGVTAGIQAAHPGTTCTNPITAAVAAFRSLRAKRIAVLTPYTADVTAPIVDCFAAAGLAVAALGSFLEPSDLIVARISEASICDGVCAVAGEHSDAVFVSCTSLRVLERVAEIEDDVGVPVVSSNMALFWHLLRLSGIEDELDGYGQLFKQQILR
ncbi:MAG: hypothetical protein OXN44_07670 [Acidimicrobiaceae bacterium]|nr:hypothetical protein [Acidimicrobiaceae bacterium]MDE0605734.1 hypothetical protein [Acidimicrobiaceae bacterium]